MPALLMITSNWVIDLLGPNRNPGREYAYSRTPVISCQLWIVC